jgi:septal ring factor EnvC (AmiA/AmiB activator)
MPTEKADTGWTEDSGIQEAIAKLKKTKEELEKRLAEIEREGQEIMAQKERLDTALRALTGEKGKKAGRNHKNGGGYKRDEVVDLVAELLKRDSPQSEKALQERVFEKAKIAGRSRSGLHLRVKEAIKDGRFKVGEKGYSLT